MGKIDCEAVLHGRLMIRIFQGRGSFINAFSGNLKILSLKIFANYKMGNSRCPKVYQVKTEL